MPIPMLILFAKLLDIHRIIPQILEDPRLLHIFLSQQQQICHNYHSYVHREFYHLLLDEWLVGKSGQASHLRRPQGRCVDEPA